MRKIMHKFIVSMVFLLLPSSLYAEDKCVQTLILHSIAFRGAVVCNQTWLDRKGSYYLLAQAQKCNKTLNKDTLIKRGFADFDRNVSELGKKEACEKLDRMLHDFE